MIKTVVGKKQKENSLTLQRLTVLDGTKAYAQLRSQVIQAGILDRSYRYYMILALFTFTGYFFCLYQLYVLQSAKELIFVAILFVFFSIQIAGLLHDAGHRAIAKSTGMNNLLGYLFSSFIVVSFGNWLLRHNAHHADPNGVDDPDVDIPVLSFTKERFLAKKGIERFLAKYQVYLFFPLLTFGSIAQRIGDLKFLISQKLRKKYKRQTIIFLVGFFLWFILPFIIFPLPKALLLFFVINFVSGFYIANIFAPNHKGMPQVKKGTKISFMEQQIMTSRNINRHFLTDFFYIGLNYQIEHHLFPNCPRNKLHKITPYVLAFCRKLRLEYTSVSIIESNKIILGELKEIAATAKTTQ